MSNVSRNMGPGRPGLALRGATERRNGRRLARMSAVIVAAGATAGMTLGCSSPAHNAKAGSAGEPHPNLAALATLGPLKPPPSPGKLGPEYVPVAPGPVLVGPGRAAKGQPIDGLKCGVMEQSEFHIHAHLTIFVNGSPRKVPAAIGIPKARVEHISTGEFASDGTCYYWLHTHAADGIIHTESPARHTYTLGQFFDIWGQPLSSTRVGPAAGHVTALYNQHLYRGDPRRIPLTRMAQVQLEVGTPLVGPETIRWPNYLAYPERYMAPPLNGER